MAEGRQLDAWGVGCLSVGVLLLFAAVMALIAAFDAMSPNACCHLEGDFFLGAFILGVFGALALPIARERLRR